MASKWDELGSVEAAPAAPEGNTARGLYGQFEQGATMGFGDEAKALIAATYAKARGGDEVGSFDDLYSDALSQIRGDLDAASAKYPISTAALNIAGAIPTGIKMAGAFPKLLGPANQGANLTARAVQLAKAGAVEGAIAGAGTAEGGPGNRAIGAAEGAAGGAALAPLVGESSRAAIIMAGRLKVNPKAEARNRAEKAFIDQIYNRDDLMDEAPDARKVMEGAKKRGVDISTAEAFDDPDLLGVQGELRDRPGPGARKAADLAEKRQTQQLPNAYEDQIKATSGAASQDEAGRVLVKVAKEAEKKVRTELSAKAKPFYDTAYQQNVPTNSKVFSNPRIRDYIDQVRKDFPEYESAPDTSLQVLDEAKKLMDDDIRSAMSGANPDRKQARLIGKSKEQLLAEMDSVSKDYARARQIYADGAPEIDALVEERVGKLSKVKPENYAQAPKELVKGSVEQTQDIAKRLPQREVRAGASALMMDARDAVRGEAFDTIQKRIFNTPKQREQFKALLGDQYQPFTQLMDIFQRVGKGQRYLQGSPTQPKMTVGKTLDDALADVANNIIDNKPRFGTWVIRKITGKTPEVKSAEESQLYSDLADVVLTDRGLEVIERLAKIKPSIEQTRNVLSAVQAGSTASVDSLIGQYVTEGKSKSKTTSKDMSDKFDAVGNIEGEDNGPGPLKITIRPEK